MYVIKLKLTLMPRQIEMYLLITNKICSDFTIRNCHKSLQLLYLILQLPWLQFLIMKILVYFYSFKRQRPQSNHKFKSIIPHTKKQSISSLYKVTKRRLS